MAQASTTVLFLSGGSLVAQAVLPTLTGRREKLRLIATSSVADDPGLFLFDAVHLAPPTARDPAGFERVMERLVEQEKVDLIVPARDDDIEFLATWRDRNPGRARLASVGSTELARITCDKWLSHEYAVSRGLPFARSLRTGDSVAIRAFIDLVGLPVLAKPRDGFNSKGIFLLDSLAQVERYFAAGNYVIQEYLGPASDVQQFRDMLDRDGVPLFYMLHERPRFSAQLVLAPDGTLVGEFCSENKPMWRARDVEPFHDPHGVALMRQCAQAFARDGWCGALNIQAQRDRHGMLRIHEFNGRLSGPGGERYYMGNDAFGKLLAAFTGHVLPASPWDSHPAQRASSRLMARAADPRDVAALQSAGSWIRPA